jgi:hypothetical protein
LKTIFLQNCNVKLLGRLQGVSWSIEPPECAYNNVREFLISLFVYLLLIIGAYLCDFYDNYGFLLLAYLLVVPVVLFFVLLSYSYNSSRSWPKVLLPITRVEIAEVITDFNPGASEHKWQIRCECKSENNSLNCFIYPDDSSRLFISEATAISALESVLVNGCIRVRANPKQAKKFLVDWNSSLIISKRPKIHPLF